MKFMSRFLLIALVALPLVLTFVSDERSVFARAEEDPTEEDEAHVEEPVASEAAEGEGEDQAEEEEGEKKTQGSPHLDCTLLFTKPVGDGMELPVGKQVEFLVGVINSGDRDFILDYADASFRYPMDYSFTIQNFSRAGYEMTVKPQQEATVMYSFMTAEVWAGRPLGLVINLAYHDADGDEFIESVFNNTVNIIELDEGLDGETFFLYVFLLAFTGLLGFLGYTAFNNYIGSSKKAASGKKSGSGSSATPTVEMGTAKNGVDYEWLPDHLKTQLKKKVTNGAVPTRQSPRLRKP